MEWTWTLQATIDTKVRVLPESIKIEPHEYANRYVSYVDRKKISGTLFNGLSVPIERLSMGIVLLDKTDGKALAVSSYSRGLYEVVLGSNGRANFYNENFNISNIEVSLLFVPYYYVPESFVYPSSYSDTAYLAPTVTIRDTVFVGGEDSSRINALKMGDLNEDGVINIADFLIFVGNYGKTVNE